MRLIERKVMSYECILFLIFKMKCCSSRLAECRCWRGPSTSRSLLRAAWTGRTCMSNCMSACFTFLPAKIRWLRRGPSLFPLVVSRLHSNSVLRGWVLLRKLFRMRCTHRMKFPHLGDHPAFTGWGWWSDSGFGWLGIESSTILPSCPAN